METIKNQPVESLEVEATWEQPRGSEELRRFVGSRLALLSEVDL